jgi:hypothetical protein
VDKAKSISPGSWVRIALFLSVWIFTAWLLLPLITLDKVDLRSSMEYFYRAAGGVVIMIILFGKTVVDLLFSQDISRRKSVLYVTFLTVYSLCLAGGIIFMAIRILLIYLNTNSSFTGTDGIVN